MSTPRSRKTTVGQVDDDVLAFTAGKDIQLDLQLVEEDCLGSAAHAVMLSRMKTTPPVLTAADVGRILPELAAITRAARAGKFRITPADQDVHLAVERTLTEKLGDLGKRIHTARSRNDQVAVDLRLWGRARLLDLLDAAAATAGTMLALGRRHAATPMVGRTHMQPAMPSSVGLWATSFTEALLDDAGVLEAAYRLNDACPLGSAAGYGVPLPVDRALTAKLLGFARPVHNVIHGVNSRGRVESVVLAACSQVMLTLSRLAQDLMIFTLPEFGYFTLRREFCTGSSIMPNKLNPDVMELMRSRAATVHSLAQRIVMILNAAPSGYNRDLQDTKEPFLEGVAVTLSALRVMDRAMASITVHAGVMKKAFSPGVFATDRAIELVGGGMPFRDAYHHVKEHLAELEGRDPVAALRAKTHLGATAGLDFARYARQVRAVTASVRTRRAKLSAVAKRLLRGA
ncbi:MAG: argininosuccinate lyase [Kiritimatiellia bacterium]